MQRTEQYNLIDFLANCGGKYTFTFLLYFFYKIYILITLCIPGLFGLLMGASVMSIVEIIYYFTLRLGCLIRSKKLNLVKHGLNRQNRVAPFENRRKHVDRKFNQIQTIRTVFRELFSNSSIHGVQYFSDRKRNYHWSERYASIYHVNGLINANYSSNLNRMWWIIAFGLSLILSGWLIRRTWIKWDQSPTILRHANEITSITDIPFPAVTICPEIKFRREKLNYSETIRLWTFGPKENISEET